MKIKDIEILNLEEGLEELSEHEQKLIVGGTCTYAGEEYSEGSRVNQAGTIMQCESDGTWQAI